MIYSRMSRRVLGVPLYIVPRHLHFLFAIMARMVEGCRDVWNVGKMRKGYTFRLKVAV